MSGDSSLPSYTLEQLAEGSGIYERTIRSYIARGLLPPPDGRGRAASYGPEHLLRLKFIQAVRLAAHPYELPLAKIEDLLRSLPSEQIERIAKGEEQVHATFVDHLDPSLLRRRRVEREDHAPGETMLRAPLGGINASYAPEPEPAPRAPAARRAPRPGGELWSSIDVTPDLRLSMRGSDVETQAQLEHLAARLRLWMQGGPPE